MTEPGRIRSCSPLDTNDVVRQALARLGVVAHEQVSRTTSRPRSRRPAAG
jgi:hypothetical protein